MAIISQETFDKFTEEEKQKIREYYTDEKRYVDLLEQHVMQLFFGKENLQLKTSKDIKTTIEKYSTEEQNKRWAALSEQEKNDNIDAYHKMRNYGAKMCEIIASNCMRKLYGEHNLMSKIKTWSDINTTKLGAEYGTILELQDWNNIKLANKLIATYKIAKLIELGYGGMITDKEWKDSKKPKFVIKRAINENLNSNLYYDTIYGDMRFIAFHTNEQREEFVSYPENVKLVEQYYMI